MWPNPQEIADLVTFNDEILNENFIFCAVLGIVHIWRQPGGREEGFCHILISFVYLVQVHCLFF